MPGNSRHGVTMASEVAARESPRPLRLIPELPDGRTRRALVRKLETMGLRPESAAAVGRAVVKPELAAMLLDAPTTYRVPGAELLVIRTDVYTSRVVADATNPRTLNDTLFPAAVAPGDQRAPFAPLEPPTSTASDFTLHVESLNQLSWQLDNAMAATIKANMPRPPIGEQGVMEPPLAVPAVVLKEGGDALTGLVLVREGSTRISHAQSILGIAAHDLLRKYVSDPAQRELIATLNGIAESSASSITVADAAKVRVGTLPIDLVVGVRPDPGTETSLGEAVAAKVAQDHLNHKREWAPAAKEVHLGEQCLIALRDADLISEEEKLWLAGRLPKNAQVDGEDRFDDDRWVELLWQFVTRTRPNAIVIRRPIATVLESEGDGRRNVSVRNDRVPLAVALAMRARRGLITDTAVERESSLLESTVPPCVVTVNWRRTQNSIEALTLAAIEEAAERNQGSASAELAARAIWYLATHGQLSKPRNDLGAGGDRRTPSELVAGMLSSHRGIRQLAQAVVDGRQGRRAARVLDDEGNLDQSGIGTPVELKDEHVRNDLVPKSGPVAPPPRNPHGEFMDAIARLGRELQAVRLADSDLRSIDDGHGRFVHETEGVASSQVNDFLEVVNDLERNLNQYEMTWRVSEAVRARGQEQNE